MKIYFVGSISGRKKYLSSYKLIVETLKKAGHQVTENTIEPTDDYVFNLTDDQKVEYYKQVLKWIRLSDVLVTEVSHPSLGIGHEISLALERGKPVLALYTEGQAPHFLEGMGSDQIAVVKYDEQNLRTELASALDFVSQSADTRFNFFISPKHVQFLDWVAQTKKIPRSVYLRQLIEKDRDNHQEYLES
jgi:2'-deoxynucleoside 5'-phosphate N-hydrolase